LLEQEKEYVQRHTQILFRAIQWEKDHHNSMHLLVANERKQAEEWLFNRFDSSQPPCLPSDLHVRFISEAKKNANNLQTDVFIASAEKEKEGNSMTREQIIYMLALYGYTSWTHINDLNSGADFHKAIKKGVEGADNLIFMITKESLESEYCMEELEYAISLNKRIIPLRLEKIDENKFPAILKDIQYIDFADNEEAISLSKNDKTDFEKDINELLKLLDADKEYIQCHKILLTQALKWQNQEKNPSMLLRGHNLEQAKIWLKIGEKREANIPLAIHEDFIKESQAKSSSERTDVFISYSRTDGDIARKFNESLQVTGKTTWFDQESIAFGADFQKEIYEGIQHADNIIFILSPESILSPYCADEVEYAQKLGKRFITLLYREIDTHELHGALSAVQWIDFRTNTTKFEKQFAEVLRTLDTDREHVQAHTKWQNEAMEWDSFDKNSDFLLRGNELLLANTWIADAKKYQKIPVITDLQKEFIKESLKEEQKTNLSIERNKQIAIAAVAIILAVAMLAGSQWYKSYQHQKELAIKNLIFESKDTQELYPDRALQLAYEAYTTDKITSSLALMNLYDIIEYVEIVSPPIFMDLKADDSALYSIASKNRYRSITIDKNNIALFDEYEGLIKNLDEDKPNSYQNKISQFKTNSQSEKREIYTTTNIYTPHFVALSDNGKYIVTHSDNGKIILFDEEGNELREITRTKRVQEAKVSFLKHDGNLLIGLFVGNVNIDSTPKEFTLFDTLANKISYHNEIVWDKKNELHKKVLKLWKNVVVTKTNTYTSLDNKIEFDLGNYLFINDDKKSWKLIAKTNKDSIIATYDFPDNANFSLLDDDNFVVYKSNTSYIITFPNRLDSILNTIAPLSAEEKIKYQIASLDDYRQVPSEMANIISKAVLFLTVFLLSILVLNYINMLYLSQKYFKIIIYVLIGFFIGLGWFIFIMDESFVVSVAFSSALSLSIAGIIFGIKDIKKQLYFNGFLYLFAAILLLIGSVLILHYTVRVEGWTGATKHLFGGVNLFIWVIVAIVWFATEKASAEFSQRNFNYFGDWMGIVVFSILLFITLSITKLSFEEDLSIVVLLLTFPFTYFLRSLIHQYVLYRFQKAPYSLSVLRSYMPTPIFLILISIGLIIDIDNVEENYVLRYSVVGFLLYSIALYVYTIFVAFKQKDKINLRANFFFWWSIIPLIFVEHGITIGYIPLTISAFIIWILPLIWWANKYRKKLQLAKLKANRAV